MDTLFLLKKEKQEEIETQVLALNLSHTANIASFKVKLPNKM